MARRKKRRKAGPAARPGEQGLSHLGTYRKSFSLDVKRRGQQKRADRRPHRLRGKVGRPDSVLGTPDMHWSGPPRLRGGSFGAAIVPASSRKRKGEGPPGPGVLDLVKRSRKPRQPEALP